MASPSGTSSGSSLNNQSFSEDHEINTNDNKDIMMMDQRKRKRMISNRESARRSRMRKQKHLDDLTAQVTHLRAENNHIHTNMNIVTQLYLNIESENSVLRAQMIELNHRLQALNDIINCMNSRNDLNASPGFDHDDHVFGGDDFLNPRSLVPMNQPILASPDVFMY